MKLILNLMICVLLLTLGRVLQAEETTTKKFNKELSSPQIEKAEEEALTPEKLSPNRSKLGQPVVTPPGSDYNQKVQLLVRGKKVYQRYCIGCHGEEGDGNGPATPRLLIKPRNFKLGIYKFRSTLWNTKNSEPGPVLPLDEDLKRTITQGLPGSSMPGFPLMPEQDKAAVIAYIKNFYQDWAKHVGNQQVVTLPPPPNDLLTKDRIERGRLLYMRQSCVFCHGPKGAGDGPAGAALMDVTRPGELVKGQPAMIKPANLIKGVYRSGHLPTDLYRVLHAAPHPNMGMMARTEAIGSASEQEVGMLPTMYGAFMDDADKGYAQKHKAHFGDGTSTQAKLESNTWDLVAYVLSLSKKTQKRLRMLEESQMAEAAKAEEDKQEDKEEKKEEVALNN